MLTVGSKALLEWGVRVGRTPGDVDVIATRTDIDSWFEANRARVKRKRAFTDKKEVYWLVDGQIVEFEVAGDANKSGLWLLESYGTLGYPETRSEFGVAVHPEVVLALKLSHRYLKNSPHFRKTMDDILALRGLGYRMPPMLGAWFKEREAETYWYKHPSLKRDKAKFFSGDGIEYVYEHDDIHEALATLPNPARTGLAARLGEYEPRPAYVYFQKDADVDVSVSKEKWDRCKEGVKLLSVLEESYVLALERSQIPNDFSLPPRTSFLIALEKVCTSITSGWWREYAWENYYRVLGMYSDDYVDRFHSALSEGRIRPYQGRAAA